MGFLSEHRVFSRNIRKDEGDEWVGWKGNQCIRLCAGVIPSRHGVFLRKHKIFFKKTWGSYKITWGFFEQTWGFFEKNMGVF